MKKTNLNILKEWTSARNIDLYDQTEYQNEDYLQSNENLINQISTCLEELNCSDNSIQKLCIQLNNCDQDLLDTICRCLTTYFRKKPNYIHDNQLPHEDQIYNYLINLGCDTSYCDKLYPKLSSCDNNFKTILCDCFSDCFK